MTTVTTQNSYIFRMSRYLIDWEEGVSKLIHLVNGTGRKIDELIARHFLTNNSLEYH